MAGYRNWNDILVLPNDFIAFSWSAPLRDLAAKMEISDVGLRKQFVSYGVPLPPQGYWNKLHAGKPIGSPPQSEARRPGQTGRLAVDSRYAGLVPVARPMPSTGPFVSEAVPESLDQLYDQELAAIGKVTVPKSLDCPHSGLVQLLRKEDKKRAKFAEQGWREPLFDSPVAQRQLKILNALFWTLAKRQHGGDAYEHEGVIQVTATIGDTRIGISIGMLGKDPRRQNWQPLAVGLPLSTPLALSVSPRFDGRQTKSWQDDKLGKLEDKIASVAASIIVEGELSFRNSLRETEEQDEKKRLQIEKKRLERLEALNQQRIQDLITSGELLRKAQDIRALVSRVRTAIANAEDVDADAMRSWEKWALGEADKIDPVLSGQFKTHLQAPTIDD